MSGTVGATETELLRLKDRLVWLEDLIEERKNSCAEALFVAKESLNERLDKMNDIRAQLNAQANEFSTKVEHDALAKEVIRRFETFHQTIDQYRTSGDAKFDADIVPLRVAIEKNAQTNWPLMISTMSVLFVLIAGGWSVMGLKIESAIAPLTITLEQAKVTSAAHTDRIRNIETDQNSLPALAADAASAKANYLLVADRNASMRADIAKNSAALVEIETQFCGQDDLRNQMHAQDLRSLAMLWRKVFNQDMQIGNAYYAKSAKCGNR